MTFEEFAEVEAIKALKARYFRLMDTKQWAAWRQVFTDDVHVRVDRSVLVATPDGAEHSVWDKGADDFVGHISTFLAAASTVHHGHMPEITLKSATEASGIWSMEDIVDHPDGYLLRGYGHYHEEYRKVDGAWKIARLRLTRLRVDMTTTAPA